MSGAMGQMAPQQGAPQIPPQMMQAMMQQRAQQPQQPQQPQQQPSMPQMPSGAPQGAPPPQAQPFAGVGGVAAQNPNLALFGQAAQRPMPQSGTAPAQNRFTPAEMGRLGRFGDQVVAHLTPGEISVPPQLQSPKVLATLDKAFHQAHVTPQQFQAGNPASSVNPATGAPEYSLWAALLPVLGAIGGSFIPGIGTAAGAALGGGAGGVAGGLIDHSTPLGTLLGAAGGAAGGYLGGGGLSDLLGSTAGSAASGAGAAAQGAAGAAATNTPFSGPEAMAARIAAGDSPGGAADVASQVAVKPSSSIWSQIPWKAAFGAGLGSGLASSFAPPAQQASALPAGFTNPMPPLNPNYGQILGNGQANAPNFQGYNPYTAATVQPFRFY